MMVQTQMSEMLTAAWRNKWWRYRYLVVALLLVNFFLINHFVFDRTLTDYVDLMHTDDAGRASSPPPPPSKATAHKPNPAEHDDADAEQESTNEFDLNTPAEEAKPTVTSHVVVGEPSTSPSHFNLQTYDFDGEYIGWPLARVCREAHFVPGLVYVCDNNSGGIGNIRNFILTCIRYGIEAGATGLIMPRIQRRSEDNLGALFSADFKPFSYFFNEAHFREAMGEHCPQMVIYNKPEDIPNASKRVEATKFYPKEMIPGGPAGDGCDERGTNRHADQYRENHDAWLHKYGRYPNETIPTTVRFRWAVFFEWQITRDGPEFANTFGDLLRFRPDIQDLAMKTIDEMAKFSLRKPELPVVAESSHKEENSTKGEEKHNNPEDAGKPADGKDASKKAEPAASDKRAESGVSEEAKRKPLDVKYFGVHLRTEGDALGFWPNFDIQSTGYLKKAKESGLKHAYIATGNATEGHRFGTLALEQLGMGVAGKTDLLKGKDLKRLNDLSWDQQALVDFLVLTKSAHFTGCSFSSFSMNIAMKRHTMTNGIYSRPWKSPGDEYSTLVGRFKNWFGDWMFMYECMWP